MKPRDWTIHEAASDGHLYVVEHCGLDGHGEAIVESVCRITNNSRRAEHLGPSARELEIARLIAAAPDLLAALQKTVSALEDIVAECEDATGGAVEDRQRDVWLGNIITECNAKLAIARAAIARTKGQP